MAEPPETRLEREYLPMFQRSGMPLTVAQSFFHDILSGAKEMSRMKGTTSLTFEEVTSLFQSDPKFAADLRWKRAEGVRDGDIAWWWKMSDVERQFLLKLDETMCEGAFIAGLRQGAQPDEAAMRAKLANPIYADLSFLDERVRADDAHCPLPAELKERVISYVENMKKVDPSGGTFLQKSAVAGSFNRLIRLEIQNGNL